MQMWLHRLPPLPRYAEQGLWRLPSWCRSRLFRLGQARITPTSGSVRLRWKNKSFLPAGPPCFRVEAVEVLDGVQLLRTTGHPAAARHEPGEPTELPALGESRPEASPRHAVVQWGLAAAVAGDQLAAAVRAPLDVAALAVKLAHADAAVGAASNRGVVVLP